MYGYFKVGCAVPKLKVADCTYNTKEILKLINEGAKKKIRLLAFPELAITGYTCGDLFFQKSLADGVLASLETICEKTLGIDMIITIGAPLSFGGRLYNACAVIYRGWIIGIVPKTYLPNYSEFYEKRWFAQGLDNTLESVNLLGYDIPFGTDLIFKSKEFKYLSFGIEICEDLWVPIPPSSYLSIMGASLIINPSASNELVTKSEYRKSLIGNQSARCICGYAYVSSGFFESSQDTVYSGHSLIFENGSLLSESERFSKDGNIILADVDLELLYNDRQKNMSFYDCQSPMKPRNIYINMEEDSDCNISRFVSGKPFTPKNDDMLSERCSDIFSIQYSGLARRMLHTGVKSIVVGISGGLDSTLALLVAVKACDYLGLSRKTVIGITMPGFGTTDRTYNNALMLMKELGIEMREISIKESAIQHFKDIGQDINKTDVTYENGQARERTQILMDVANMEGGFVVGTGDLSELALGWATYNGDHMSMYGVNSGVPKTLVRVLVKWVSDNGRLGEKASEVLTDILNTPVSPELLPPDKDGKIDQKTEEIVGPYELHDFFLYYFVRCGFSPRKVYFLAQKAFDGVYEKEIILKWLKNFYRRFFSQQFKRSCMPDGPKVGTINLSPRGDWRMPSDAVSSMWLKELEEL